MKPVQGNMMIGGQFDFKGSQSGRFQSKSPNVKGELCPRCKKNYLDPTPARNALSRKDNKTYICNACGFDEAMEDARK